MNTHVADSDQARGWMIPMTPRSPHEPHRAATPLELFFDLVFVVAVTQAASGLHHGIVEDHIAAAVLSFAQVFFAIWWAWMNFTWFASAYDTDDVPYRLAVFVQLAGALIIAAGVPYVFAENHWAVVTAGYVVMRLALVGQWLRAARADPPHRATAMRYAFGVTVCQAGWIALLSIPTGWTLFGFLVLVAAELLVPIWAEQRAMTTWHPHHIVERYGLFTIIVLGESILSATVAVQSAIHEGAIDAALVAIIVGGLLIVVSLWWLYFDGPMQQRLTSLAMAFTWGYGHLLIFAAAAAVGAGLAVAVDYTTQHAAIAAFAAGQAVAVPVALYLLGLWAISLRIAKGSTRQAWLLPLTALVVLCTPLVAAPVLLIGLLLVALLTAKLVTRYRVAAAPVR